MTASSSPPVAFAGREATLRPVGWGRYFEAAFLGVWLTFWIVGETAAAAFVVSMLVALAGWLPDSRVTSFGRSLLGGGPGSELGFAALFLFLGVWLLFWTIGGVTAGHRLLRLLAGADRIVLDGAGIRVTRRAGPFRRRTEIARSDVRRIRLRPHDKAVVANTSRGSVVVSDLGSIAEREALCEWLRGGGVEAGVTPAFDPLTPPPGWRVRRQADGVLVLARPTRGRYTAAAVLSGVLAVAGYGWWVEGTARGTRSLAVPAILALLALLAAWIAWARTSWTAADRRLEYRFRFGPVRRERLFQSAGLYVEHDRDSDGDSHYKLVVRDAAGQRTIDSATFDDLEVVECGRWVSAATGFPLKA